MSPAAQLSRWPLLVVTMLLGLLAPMLLAVPSADATHVDPVVYAGNPHCDDLIPADDYLFVLNDVPPITQVIPLSNGDLTGTLSITVSSDGKTFDFSLTGAFGVSAVVVKGGPNVNLYDYRPIGGEVADTGLRSPLQNASLPGLSHMDFCFVELNPSTTLSLATDDLDVDGVSTYDPVTNTLTVLENSAVSLDAVETNDGNVALTDTYVLFEGVACAGGNQKDGGTLLPDADFTATCDFNATLGETTVVVTGHGDYGGKDVTWCEDEENPPADIRCDQDERDEITIVGINPSTDLSLSAWDSTPGSGAMTGSDPETWTINVDYGGDVDLTFAELNDGTEAGDTLTDVEIVFTGADECSDDAGGVTLLAGETHTVTCDTIEDITSDMTITAIGHGTDALGNDVTWCADPTPPTPAGVTCDQDEKVVVEIVVDTPSTSLSLDTSDLDSAGVAAYDETTNTLTVLAGSPVDLDATETNDGEVDLTDAYVIFDGVACAGGNQQPAPGVALPVDGTLDVTCSFNAPLGETTVTLTGHGTDRLGNDVTWCTDPTTPPDATFCDQDERDEITIVGINPSTELSLTDSGVSVGSITEVLAADVETWTINVDYGGSVDLTFTETNDGTEDDDVLEDVYIEFVNGAPECADAGVASLAPGDTHVVTCDTIENITASRTIEAIGHGTTVLGTDVTWCSDPVLAPYGVTCDQDEKVVVSIVVNFGEGCTPGLWRQYDNWLGRGKKADWHWIRGEWADSPYSYGDNAGAVFGVAAWNDSTLGELTQLGGGGMNALGRHAAAALQNIMHPDIDYFDYATGDAAGLIADVQAAVAAGDDAIEALHLRLADFNDQGTCELSKN